MYAVQVPLEACEAIASDYGLDAGFPLYSNVSTDVYCLIGM